MKNHIRPSTGTTGCPVLLLALILAGCATSSVVRKDPTMNEWRSPGDAVAVTTPAPASLPSTVVSAPMEQAVITALIERRSLPTNTISDLELADEADVVTILRALAKAADLNVLISPQVSGRMGFAFKNVPWDQAFRSVIHSAGLTYDWEGDVLRVMTIEDMKRGLEMETVIKQREDVRAEKRRIEPMVVQVIPIKYSKARNIGATVKTLLVSVGNRESGVLEASRSTVSIDEENNAIVIHAIRDDSLKAISLVEQLDRIKPQVHIEARIIEATQDTARQLGVQWGGVYAQINGGRMVTMGGQGVTRGGYNSDFPAQFALGAVDPTAGFSLGVISEKIGGSELLNMQLTALQSRGRINILSSPSITTLDNEPAIIESGEERAYRETSGTGNDLDVSVEWKKAVLKLEVTPHVVDGEYLRVEIIANKDSFDETKPQANNEYPVNTKRAQTTVLLRNGETVVIGGLSQEGDSETQSGIPYLMDIPGLGHLFKSRGQAKKFDETLIFITPRILTSGPK
jgi:type IV pilus assembly protein PilQ